MGMPRVPHGPRHIETGTVDGHYRTAVFGLFGMMPRCTMVLLITLLIAPVWALRAQPPPPGLDLEDCVGAWLNARASVDTLGVAQAPSAASTLPHSTAACVILRHRGRTIGVGAHHRRAAHPDAAIVRLATEEAIEFARRDDVLSRLSDEDQSAAGQQLTLQLEIAGPLRPLLGPSFVTATEHLRPGLEGLAMRHGDRWWFQFPSQLRLTNAVAGPDRLYALALASGLSPRQIEMLRDRGEVSLYSFETIDLAQPATGRPPGQILGGAQVVVAGQVTPSEIATARDLLARHILSRCFVRPEGLRLLGTYAPIADSFDTRTPSLQDRFLVAMSLAMLAQSPGVEPDLAREAHEMAEVLIAMPPMAESDAAVDQSGSHPTDPVAAALRALTMDRLDQDGSTNLTSVRPALEAMADETDDAVRRVAHDIAVMAAALAIVGDQPADPELAVSAARRARNVLPVSRQSGLLPWLGWIEQASRGHRGDLASDRMSLRIIRDQLIELQATAESASELDAGGFHLSPGVRGVSSQSLRPGITLTEMLHDPSFADADRDRILQASHRRFLRYLLQLCYREDPAGACRRPDRALGGVRQSTCDSRQHLAAQAMGLMILSQALPRTAVQQTSE